MVPGPDASGDLSTSDVETLRSRIQQLEIENQELRMRNRSIVVPLPLSMDDGSLPLGLRRPRTEVPLDVLQTMRGHLVPDVSLHVLLIDADASRRAQVIACAEQVNKMEEKVTEVRVRGESVDQAALLLRRGALCDLVLIATADTDHAGIAPAYLLSRLRRQLGANAPIVAVAEASDVNIGLLKPWVRAGVDAILVRPLDVETIRNLWQLCLRRDPDLFERKSKEASSSAASCGGLLSTLPTLTPRGPSCPMGEVSARSSGPAGESLEEEVVDDDSVCRTQ